MAEPSKPKQPATLRRRVLFLVYLALVTGLLVEGALRILTKEVGGQRELFGYKLVPFEIVPGGHSELIGMSFEECPYVAPDPELGWVVKPNGRSPTKPFASNSLGLRSAPEEIPVEKTPDVARVLLVGDSFTHGDEVPWEETWARKLQERLGASYQVLNGGVPGYGTDQAVLRYELRLRELLKPDLVVLGIVRDDVPRNVNLFRALYHHWTDLPWSKPRFVPKGEGLELVNCPVVPPAEVEATLRDFAHSPLRGYDSCYRPDLYTSDWRQVSRLWTYFASRRVHSERYDFIEGLRKEGAEGTIVTARLARRFSELVRAAGGRPLVLFIPQWDDVPSYRPGGHPPMRHVIAAARELGVETVDAGPAFAAAIDEGRGDTAKSFFVNGVGHPNARGTSIIAEVVEKAIRGR